MDFIRYAERAAALVNADLPDEDGAARAPRGPRVAAPLRRAGATSRRCRSFQAELRPVFEASDVDDVRLVVGSLNDLLASHPVTPMISDHDPDHLHMHVTNRASSVAELLIAESLMGLANLVCDLGATRLGICSRAALRQRLRRHLAQPVAPLLLRPVLLARQRRGLPGAPEGGRPQ